MAGIIKDSSHFNQDNLLFDEVLIKGMFGGYSYEDWCWMGHRGEFFKNGIFSDNFNGIRLDERRIYGSYYIKLDNNNNPIEAYYIYGD